MFFLMICHHKPNITTLRDALRPAHREYVASGGEGLAKVYTGSGLQADAGDEGIGNFGIIEADSFEAARAFAEGDPFHSGGVIERIELIRMADTFQAHRIDPMTK